MKRFPRSAKTGYADGDGGHSVVHRMDQEWYEDVVSYLLPLYKGDREAMAQDITTFISDPQRADGSTENITVKILIWRDKAVGSIIERRTQLNMFEYLYCVYYDTLETARLTKA